MPDPTTTNVDLGSVTLANARHQDEILDSLAVTEVVEGTILARTTIGGKLGLFDVAGVGGLGVPVAVMPNAITPIVGDNYVRPIIAGDVRKERLVIASGVATITPAVLDLLRATSIIPLSVEELNILDNQ